MRRVLAPIAAAAFLAAGPAAADDAPPSDGGAAPCFAFDFAGSDARDVFEGTSASDHVAGFGGDDALTAFGGEDCVSAGAGDDVLRLGPGDDVGFGRSGGDLLDGGAGDDTLQPGLGPDVADGGEGDDLVVDEPGDAYRDRLSGGPGDDVVRAGTGGRDALEGGPGDDVLDAANGAADTVDCGSGADRVLADEADALAGCERPVLGFHPAVTATPATGDARTTFRLSWQGEARPPRLESSARPQRASGCATGSWRVRTTRGGARLLWRGRLAPCPGRYAWRVVRTLDGPARRIDCERRAGRDAGKGAPPEHGCVARVLVGEAAFVVG